MNEIEQANSHCKPSRHKYLPGMRYYCASHNRFWDQCLEARIKELEDKLDDKYQNSQLLELSKQKYELKSRIAALEGALKAVIDQIQEERYDYYDNSNDERVCTACHKSVNANIEPRLEIEHEINCAWLLIDKALSGGSHE